ncbi:hypothetical protein SAY86_001480 [Trapa natans]|uniref:Glycosyltransferase 61 catalytic domain-containing protein n=1 Tax=Trapa natans TaxID=22666 RepID=A0AAN7MDM8_TRANT|nr:hypothetical protein SAY86_001480 [Trapa natans]
MVHELAERHLRGGRGRAPPPSKASQGRLLCLKGRDARNGSRNSYALARSDALPEGSKLLPGLTFVSDTYYDYENLWHGLTAIVPFVGWSMKNRCVKPKRWILYHQGEIRSGMGSWVRQVVEANYGEEVQMESFEGEGAGGEDDTYCLEEAVVMRHNLGKMGEEKKLKVSDQVRCKARERCGVHGGGKDNTSTAEVNETGKPLIRMTLLMRRVSRSFKNASAVVNVFAGECKRFSGCLLKVVQSEELSFCDQVRVMTETDIVVSPHGAQLTNMVFMERGSSVMELFPRGWLELAGVGQYAHHWMAKMAGMNHRGAWWEPLADGKKECPDPKDDARCFTYYKNGKVGHNETHFASWARDVLNQVRTAKLTEVPSENPNPNPSRCPC